MRWWLVRQVGFGCLVAVYTMAALTLTKSIWATCLLAWPIVHLTLPRVVSFPVARRVIRWMRSRVAVARLTSKEPMWTAMPPIQPSANRPK